MIYIGTPIYSDTFCLSHHGIKGQKWGVRRFQNEDGTYTKAGRERYNQAKDNYEKAKKERKDLLATKNVSFKDRRDAKNKVRNAKSKVELAKSKLKLDKMADKGKTLIDKGVKYKTDQQIATEHAGRVTAGYVGARFVGKTIYKLGSKNNGLTPKGVRSKIGNRAAGIAASTAIFLGSNFVAGYLHNRDTRNSKYIREYYKRNRSLSHHGVKGQKWGVRRYQNTDGSLTAEGRRRLGKDKTNPRYRNPYLSKKSVFEMNDDELRHEIVRLGLERQYTQYMRELYPTSSQKKSAAIKRASSFVRDAILGGVGSGLRNVSSNTFGIGVNSIAKALGIEEELYSKSGKKKKD